MDFPDEGIFRRVLVWVYLWGVPGCTIFRGGESDPRFEQIVPGWLGKTHGTVIKIPQLF